MEAFLAGLPNDAFGLILLICRIGAVCMLAPGVGEAELPALVRLAFTVALTALLFGPLFETLPALPPSGWRLAGMVGAEIVTGLWLGWLARLVMQALAMAGQFIASMTGLANVLQPDPALGAQSTALAKLFSVAAPVAIFASGLYALPLSALAGSYRLIAPGTLLPAADTTLGVVRAVGQAFGLGLRLAAPFIIAGLLWQGALGLLARLVPNLQVFAAAMPGQILGGLMLLALLAGGMMAVWQDAAREVFSLLPGL